MRFLSTVCHSTHPDPRPRLRTGTRGVSEISHRTRDEQTDLRRRREMPASESSWRSRPGRGCRACMAPDHQSNRRPMRHCSRALWRPIDSQAQSWNVDHCARSSAGRVIPIRSDMVCGEECEEWTPGSQDSNFDFVDSVSDRYRILGMVFGYCGGSRLFNVCHFQCHPVQ